MGRTAPQRQLDAIHRFVVSLDKGFDAAVWQVANVAMDAFGRSARGGEHPESDSLHTPADQKPTRDDHETPIIAERAEAIEGTEGLTTEAAEVAEHMLLNVFI